jgi:hypothetical protein
VYALYEWARTEEYDDDVKAFSFASTLFETSVDIDDELLAFRWERTTRPEEERLEDPFRSARPQRDVTLLGVTRWSGFTVHAAHRAGNERLTLMPFVEVGRLRVEEITGALFDPAAFYGNEVQWTLSAGIRVMAGVHQLRVGRYGVALRGESHSMVHE